MANKIYTQEEPPSVTLEEIKLNARRNGKGKYKGKEFRLQIYDGYACYVVKSLDPVELIHVTGTYESELAQYLPKERIIEEIYYQERLDKFFAENGKI